MACQISKSDWAFAFCMLVTICFWGSASTSRIEAAVVSFGSGSNQFQMEFVTISDPGNSPDNDLNARPISSTLGSVGYTFGIGKFEVSRDMITKFNAAQSLQIILQDMSVYGGNGSNKPATGVSWNEAARFVNWLNTSSGKFVAYKFTSNGVNDNIALWSATDTLDYDASNPYRSKRATYVLPTYNEWYKAAYYDPTNKVYYDFATGRNTAPAAVASGTAANTAVYNGKPGPADVNQAGGLSPYGVMGLGGNVQEWEETSGDLANSSGSSTRGFRGGNWNGSSISSSNRNPFNLPSQKNFLQGFRVTSLSSSSGGQVPEPSTITIFGLGALCLASRARRKSDATSC